jgi:dihydropteroate synthase
MKAQDTNFCKNIDRLFDEKSGAFVMGILNITSDSFFDGGMYTSDEFQFKKADKMIKEGVDIIDIGAYSTKPGAKTVPEKEEASKLVSAIKLIRKEFPNILISADTFRANVAKQAIEAGANIINDISGGSLDNKMFDTVAQLKVPYILMHIQGKPENMQNNPIYNNVTKEVYNYLDEKIETLNNLGVKNIIIDPGFGFGKTLENNYNLLNKLSLFKNLKAPILVGLSRKSMIYKLLNIDAKDALNGTSILNTIALLNGAKIIRVHDVKEAKEAVFLIEKLNQ